MVKNIALYPGTFDIVSFGHLDIIKRASSIFARVVIGVARNVEKSPLFSIEERVEILEDVVGDLPNVTISRFDGLTVHFAQSIGAHVIIRGLRAVSDFEYEIQLAMMNRELEPEVETLLLPPSIPFSFLSSNLIKEIASFGGDIKEFVPPIVEKRTMKKLREIDLRAG